MKMITLLHFRLSISQCFLENIMSESDLSLYSSMKELNDYYSLVDINVPNQTNKTDEAEFQFEIV